MDRHIKAKTFLLNIILCLSAISLSISISIMEIGLGVLLLCLLAYLYQTKTDVTKDCPFFIPFFIYWLVTLIPFFIGSKQAVIWGNAFDVWPMLYIFVGFYFVSRKNVRVLLFCIILGCIALSASISIDVFIFHKLRGDGFLGYMTGGEILALGGVLSAGIIISGYEKNIMLKLFYAIAFIILIIGITCTETRGALISLVGSITFMLIAKFRMKGLLASIFMVLLIGSGVYFSPMGSRFFEVFKDFWNINTSHGWRLELWKNTFILIKEYPIFGIGNGAYAPLIKILMPHSPIGLPLSHAHNGYIAQLVLFGVTGLLAFCFFYGRIAIGFLKYFRSNNFAFIGVAMILAYVIQGFTENNFQDSELIMFSSFTFGLLFGALKNKFNDKIC